MARHENRDIFAGYGHVTTQDGTSRPEPLGLRLGWRSGDLHTAIALRHPIRVARLGPRRRCRYFAIVIFVPRYLHGGGKARLPFQTNHIGKFI